MVAPGPDPESTAESRLYDELTGATDAGHAAEVRAAPPSAPGGPSSTNLAVELAYLEGWSDAVAEFERVAHLHRELTDVLLELDRRAGPPFSVEAARTGPVLSPTELLATRRLAAAQLRRWSEVRARLKELAAARPPPGGLGLRFPGSTRWTGAPNGARYLATRQRALGALAVLAVLSLLFVVLVESDVGVFGGPANLVASWVFPLVLVAAYAFMAASFVSAAAEADIARRTTHLAARLAVRRLDHDLPSPPGRPRPPMGGA